MGPDAIARLNGAGHAVDVEALAQAHINAVSGACLAMGVKYAGSANSGAQAVLHEYATYLLQAKNVAPDSTSGEIKLFVRFKHTMNSLWGPAISMACSTDSIQDLLFCCSAIDGKLQDVAHSSIKAQGHNS